MNSCCHYQHVPVDAFQRLVQEPAVLHLSLENSWIQSVGSRVSKISVQVPSLCGHTFLIRRVTVKFPIFFPIPLLMKSFLAAFSLLFFPCPSHFFFSSLLPMFPFPFTSSLFFPPSLEVSLLSLELTALYWLSKYYFMPGVQMITMKHQSKGSVFPGTCIQQFLFLACCMCLQYCKCFYAVSSFKLQGQTTRGSILHAEAPADSRLLGCFLFVISDSVSWKCYGGSEVLILCLQLLSLIWLIQGMATFH